LAKDSDDHINDIKPIPSPKLKKALSIATQGLGQSYRQALSDELENHGIVLLGKTSYSLSELGAALEKIFDEDGSNLLMQRVRKALAEVAS